MPVQPPKRWTARTLTSMLMPHLFRSARNAHEAIGVFKEKVPLDADQQHMFIKRKDEKQTKEICEHFRINQNPPRDAPKGYWWSVATGEWVPRHYLKLDLIFPFALGPMVAQEISPRIQLRSGYNGMLLPSAVWAAFNKWNLVIAPEKSQRYDKTPRSLLFKILVQDAGNLLPVHKESSLKVGDLDRKPLHFRSPETLNPHSCYFHSCCAVWKLTYLEQPDRSPEEFWEVFQYKMDGLWGTLKEREHILNIFKPPELLKPGEVDGRKKKLEDFAAAESPWEQMEEKQLVRRVTSQGATF